MKKLSYIVSTLVISLSLLLSSFEIGSNQASAAPKDMTNPYTTGCAYNKPITYQTNYIYRKGKQIGYLQLRGSVGCHTAWAYLKLYSPAPRNNYAKAYIQRYKRGLTLSCDSKNGNKAINYKQTSCYTPQIYDRDPYKARAGAFFTNVGFVASTNWH